MASNDDWRLHVVVHEHGAVRTISERLDAGELHHDLKSSFEDRVIVSVDGADLFCYAGTREQAQAAERLIRSVAAEHSWPLQAELTRWHPDAERWEDAERPLPLGDDERALEHQAMIEQERIDARRQGFPDYEVRAELHSHRQTVALSERLRAEGLVNVRRWRYLLVGATDEDQAAALADRVRAAAPADADVRVVGTARGANPGMASPFALLRRMGG